MSTVRHAAPSPARLLVVDDSPTVRLQMSAVLQREGFEVRTVHDAEGAVSATREWRPHCILLDYFLTDVSGEAVVATIRSFDPRVQIVIITGHAEAQPARHMLQRLDIQGYHDKLDGVERLLVWVEAALKSYARIEALARHAEVLRGIIDHAATLSQEQAPEAFLDALLDGAQALVARPPAQQGELDLLLARRTPNQAISFLSARGRYRSFQRPEQLLDAPRALLDEVTTTRRIGRHPERVCVPLNLAGDLAGALLIDLPPGAHVFDEHLHLYAHQAAMAIEHARLRALISQDPITGLVSRAQLMQRLDEWLRISIRRQLPLSVIAADLDDFGALNAAHGRAFGDRLLGLIGHAVRDAIRETDIAGRSADRFIIVLPATSPEHARKIALRICQRVCEHGQSLDGQPVGLTASVGYGGFSTLPLLSWMRRAPRSRTWGVLTRALLDHIDAAVCRAREAGGAQVREPQPGAELDRLLYKIAYEMDDHDA